MAIAKVSLPSVSEDENGAYGRVSCSSCRVSSYSKDLKDCNNCNTYLSDAVPVHVLYVFGDIDRLRFKVIQPRGLFFCKHPEDP